MYHEAAISDYKWTSHEDARITENGPGYVETCGEWRLRQYREDNAHVTAWRECVLKNPKHPFRFEDLLGYPEPSVWGPKYTKPVKAKKRILNDETNIPTNAPSGQKRCFDATKHRAKIRAESVAEASAAYRRKPDRDLIAAYDAAMLAKITG